MLIAFGGSLAAFVAVTSVLLWAAGVRAPRAEARLGKLASSRRTAAAFQSPFGDRVMVPFFDTVAQMVVASLPQSFVSRITHSLTVAGRPMTTQAFFAVVVLTGLLFPLGIVLLSVLSSNGNVSPLALFGALMVGVLGMFLPFIWLRRAARTRRLRVWKSLADAFDLVTVSVEAGLGLDAALRQVAEKLEGPLAEEIAQTLREVGMGRPRRDALEDMAERVDVRELETFVNAIVQAEQLGTSLGRVLRSQAVTLRVRRRQRAEESSRKAPVKLVFPLVFFIMPTFFIITLGPIFVRVVNFLSE